MANTLVARPLRLLALMALLLATALAVAVPEIVAQQSGNTQADQAVGWLIDQQVIDGGFSPFGGDSDAGTTADAVYALVAAGVDPATVTTSGNSPLDFLIASAGDAVSNPGLAGKVALALVAAGLNPRDADGVDLIAAILDGEDPESGAFGPGPINHSYAMLALVAAGESIPSGMVDTLLSLQIEDGSWAFTGSTEPGDGDSNSTALAVQALAAAGVHGDHVDLGVEFILSLQDDNGAIAYDFFDAPDLAGDANSTAQAIQALIAAGHDASAQLVALASFQNSSGAFFWRSDWSDDSLLATAQAVPAILGQALPIEPLPVVPVDPIEPGDGLEDAMRPADPIEGCRFFAETSHNLCDSFETFWLEHGGLHIFGFPLTEPFVDDNERTAQYFERARFELHPENVGTPWEVLLGRLGAEQIEYDASR